MLLATALRAAGAHLRLGNFAWVHFMCLILPLRQGVFWTVFGGTRLPLNTMSSLASARLLDARIASTFITFTLLQV